MVGIESHSTQKECLRINEFDFIKGVAILAVITHHFLCVYQAEKVSYLYFHVGQAVALFLLVSLVIRYKKYENDTSFRLYSFKKEQKAIFLPYILAQIFLILVTLFTHTNPGIREYIASLGIGWGSYYPFIFFQMMLIAPFVFKLLKANFMKTCVLLLVVHVGIEVTCVFFNVPQFAYCAICTRYLFLFAIAYVLYDRRCFIKYKLLLISLALLSLIWLFFNVQLEYNFGMYHSLAFCGAKFPRDFITLFVFVFLWKLYKLLPPFCSHILIVCGRNSWHIFIIQMVFFPTFSSVIKSIPINACIAFVGVLIAAVIWKRYILKFAYKIIG